MYTPDVECCLSLRRSSQREVTDTKIDHKAVLAYFLKLPGNFGQHNLANGCPHAQTEARYPTRTLHKRLPVRFFSRKNVKFARSHFLPRNLNFFSRRPAVRRRRAAPEKILAFWLAFALISTKLSAVFSGGIAGSSCPQCTHTRTLHTHKPRAAVPSLPLPLLTSLTDARRCESAPARQQCEQW